MARRRRIKKRDAIPDPVYNNVQVAKFINRIMKKGKKTIARKIVYGAFEKIREKTKKEPLEVFNQALTNASPLIEVRPKRIGGATYQVPVEVRGDRKMALAMRWIIQVAKARKGKPMKERLAEELLETAENRGAVIKKKENVHKMAEANRAFAHFAW
ncbi:30S ribosomal protein S7 [Parcubacteria bacterium DG_74_3]|nr:MAG: 30S ribosomal protein S7 [Parcubacteria bacterium DG_74_3]